MKHHKLSSPSLRSSSSRMRVIYHNWSAMKQRPHPQSVAEISRHSVLSGDRIRQCGSQLGQLHHPEWPMLMVQPFVSEMTQRTFPAAVREVPKRVDPTSECLLYLSVSRQPGSASKHCITSSDDLQQWTRCMLQLLSYRVMLPNSEDMLLTLCA